MAKPIIRAITPFDASQGVTIAFGYSGNQPYSNTINVYDGDTLNVVFTETENSMKYTHTISPEVSRRYLTNGKQYAIDITTTDSAGEKSAVSDKMFFYTFSTPILAFSNVEPDETIRSSSLTANVSYSQAEGENLNQVIFYLYDISKKVLTSSGTIYDLSYTFDGFDNQVDYYLRVVGQTEHGILADTGYVHIFVKFENPNAYSIMYANQDEAGTGTVTYWTNMSIVRPDRDDYIVADGKVDLRNDYITYNSGYLIENDFTLAITHTYTDGVVCTFTNDSNDKIELSMIPSGIGSRYMLDVNNSYKIFSDYIPGDEETIESLTVYVQKKDDIYDITPFYTLSGLLTGYNIYLNGDEPHATQYSSWEDIGYNGVVTDKDIVVSNAEPTPVSKYTIWIGGND